MMSMQSRRWGSVAFRRMRESGFVDRAEHVVVVLEDVRVDRTDPKSKVGSVLGELGVVVDPVPRDMEGDARCAARELVHLSGVGDLLIRMARRDPFWANTLNLVPELPKAHDGSSTLRSWRPPATRCSSSCVSPSKVISCGRDGCLRNPPVRVGLTADGTPPRAVASAGRPERQLRRPMPRRTAPSLLPPVVHRFVLHRRDSRRKGSARLEVSEQRQPSWSRNSE